MKTIYKYELEGEDIQTLQLPANHKILCARNQNEKFVLYIQLDTLETEMIDVEILIAGTGQQLSTDIDTDYIYIDTVGFGNMSYVFHIYHKICEFGLS